MLMIDFSPQTLLKQKVNNPVGYTVHRFYVTKLQEGESSDPRGLRGGDLATGHRFHKGVTEKKGRSS